MDDFAEFSSFIRLGNHSAETKILVTAHGSVCRVAAGNDCVHCRIELDKLFQSFLPTHASRQGQVQNDGVKTLARFELLAICVYAFESGGRRGDLIPEVGKSKFDQGANRFFVVDHEDAAGAGDRSGDRPYLLDW